jgi:exonuclease SbcD
LRILHTADWHIGRTFHGHSTLGALREVLGAIPGVVEEHKVDVVVVAGDIFDSSTPSGDAFTLLQNVLLAIRDAGAQIIVISGNHDSAARLGFAGPFAGFAGVHIVTDPLTIDTPVTLTDEHGEIDFYCIPFLEPALIRHRFSDETLRNQADALRFAMGPVHEAVASRSAARAVVVGHTFVVGGESESSESERPITVGTVDAVPLDTFDGIAYVALGHIHGAAKLSERVRYSGALMHYSFGEAGKPRGGWLIDLGADGVSDEQWIDLPVPRPLQSIEGELEQVLVAPEYDKYREYWVRVVLTDSTRPMDAMRRLQRRFPWCTHVEHRPATVTSDGATSYAERVQNKTDTEILDAFLTHVRNGEAPTDVETELLHGVIEAHRIEAARR